MSLAASTSTMLQTSEAAACQQKLESEKSPMLMPYGSMM